MESKELKSVTKSQNREISPEDIKIEKYLYADNSSSEQQLYAKRLIDSIKQIDNIEQYLTQKSALNSQAIVSQLEKLERKGETLKRFELNAKQNKANVSRELDELSQHINIAILVVQQENNLHTLCRLYESLNTTKFADKSQSMVYFENDNHEQNYHTKQEIENCLPKLYDYFHYKEEEINVLDSLLEILDNKITIVLSNKVMIYKYGVDKQLIEKNNDYEIDVQLLEQLRSRTDANNKSLSVVQKTINKITQFLRSLKNKSETNESTV